jgi:hypothetical protein
MLAELLPSPVLSVGLTGHRNITMGGKAAEAIEHCIGAVLGALQRALAPAIAQEAAYFSATTPMMRFITMGAEGADLLGAHAARRCGLMTCYVIPFALDEYRKDFSTSSAAIAADLMPQAASLLQLPGRRDEGARAYERANEVILSNIDLLLAVWDGQRARGRAGTGDVVQAAVGKHIPVIIIDPQAPSAASVLAMPPIDDFEPPAASDLSRKPLPADLTDFVHSILRPPPRLAQRQGLIDLIAETPRSAAWRIEYTALLRVVAGRPIIRRALGADPSKTLLPSGDAAARSAFANCYGLDASGLDHARDTIDRLAVQYGQLFRSSSVSQYFVVILGVWISGMIGLLVPSLAAASIATQLLANALVLADSAFRSRHRWQERWLDYRVVAERIRWLGFSCAFGLGAAHPTRARTGRNASWTDWYLQRMAQALGPPQGKIDAASVATAADRLTEVEIPDQISYHRAAVRQLGTLERRLSFAAQAALVAALAVAFLLIAAALRAGSFEALGWRQYAIALLAVLPATMTGLNGLRVDADLVRLVERSAQTITLLFRIRRVILAAPQDYDHVVANMQRLAATMGSELAEWRFVIESRRSRDNRRRFRKKRRRFF